MIFGHCLNPVSAWNLWCIGPRIYICHTPPNILIHVQWELTFANQLNYKHTWLFSLSAYGFLTVRLFSVKNSSSLIQHEKWVIYFLSVMFPRLPQTALDFHLCMEHGTQDCYESHREWVCSLHQSDEEIRLLGFSRERFVVGTATRSVLYSCRVQPES